MALPPFPAVLSSIIEVEGAPVDSDRWGDPASVWGTAKWTEVGWQDVTPESMNAQVTWGSDTALGVLSVPAAGDWSVRTYDPERLLDPANQSSPYASSLHPGTPVRLRYKGATYPGITNGDFVAGVTGWTTLTAARMAWSFNASGGNPGASATCAGTGTAATEVSELSQAIAFPATGIAGRICNIGVDFRKGGSPNPTGPIIAVMMRVTADDGIVTDYGRVQASNSLAWIQLRSEFRMPSNAVSAALVIQVGTGHVSGNSCVIDNASVSFDPAITVREGVIDEIRHNISTSTGLIRATDGVSALVAARIAAGATGAPATLRSMARWAIARAGLTTAVEDTPLDDAGVPLDPAIGAGLTDEASVWQWLLTGALDCLHAVWMDRLGVVRFRSFGAPRDTGLELGGADGIAFDDLDTESNLAGVYSRVIAYDKTAPSVAISRSDVVTYESRGDAFYERKRPVPVAATWADSVLADRSRADLTYRIGTLRMQTEAQLLQVIDTGMVDIARIIVDSVVPPISASGRTLGGSLEANTESGWSAKMVAYVPGREWEDSELPPIPPPITPPATQRVVRTYNVSKDTRAARSGGGTNLGSGTEGQLPVGYWSGYRNRVFIDFAAIPWGDVLKYVSAELRVTTSTQVNVGFGSAPKVDVKRVTQSWSEGTASSPSGSNATIYPGPSVTSTGSVRKSVTRSQSTTVVIDVTELIRAWAPAAAGGQAQKQYGLGIFSASEDSAAATTEFLSRESGASTDAELRITVDIPA